MEGEEKKGNYRVCMRKVKILGGGVSGLTCAINLAREGVDVEVYEIRNNSGCRFHGDFQGLENWSSHQDALRDLQGKNIDLDFEHLPIREIRILNEKEEVWLNFKRPMFYLVERGTAKHSFDQAIKEQAISEGVEIRFKKTIPESKADIIAYGPKKAIAKAYGINFKTKSEDGTTVLLSDKAAFKGYSYLLIYDKRASLCSVVFREHQKIKKYFEYTKKYFEKLGVKIKNSKKIGGIGYFHFPPLLSRNKTIYIGEAAGLQDFLWGFGMRIATTSGYLGAKSILERKNYTDLINSRLGKKLKASIVNRFIWEKFSGEDYSYMINKLKEIKGNLEFFRKIFNLEPKTQKILYPIALAWYKVNYSATSDGASSLAC